MSFCALFAAGLLAIFAFEICLWLVKAVLTASPDGPANLRVVQIGRDNMGSILTYSVSVAAPVDADVVSRELVVTVDGVSRDPVTFNGDVTDLGTVDVPEGSSVVFALTDIDDAGNASVPAVVDFVAADTLRPEQPGAFNVSLVAETQQPDNG